LNWRNPQLRVPSAAKEPKTEELTLVNEQQVIVKKQHHVKIGYNLVVNE
jgi:hypothetical protein